MGAVTALQPTRFVRLGMVYCLDPHSDCATRCLVLLGTLDAAHLQSVSQAACATPSIPQPKSFTAYSFSTGEAILTALYFPVVLAVVPASELAAFLFTVHMMLINAIHHCGYELYPRNRKGTPLFDWLTTTTHHDLHHANGRWNYGLYFTHWDRWMGTEHPQYHEMFSRSCAS